MRNNGAIEGSKMTWLGKSWVRSGHASIFLTVSALLCSSLELGCRSEAQKNSTALEAARSAAPPQEGSLTQQTKQPGEKTKKKTRELKSKTERAQQDKRNVARLQSGQQKGGVTTRSETQQEEGGQRNLASPKKGKLKVRRSPIAGSWYPGDKETLELMLNKFLSKAEESGRSPGYPIALVVPHAGYRYSGQVAAHAYYQLKGRSYARVFVLGPSHYVFLHGISVAPFDAYKTPLGLVELDTKTIESLAKEPLFQKRSAAHEKEHSVEMQVPFLQHILRRFKLVPMVVGRLTKEEVKEVAKTLKKYIAPGDLLIASSDFTHYGRNYGYWGPPGNTFKPAEAPAKLQELMNQATGAIQDIDLERFWQHKEETGDTICGFLPIAILLATLPTSSKAQLLKTDTSGNITGSYANSVSYVSIVFSGLWPYTKVEAEGDLSTKEKKSLLKLARFTLNKWVRNRSKPNIKDAGIILTKRLKQLSGAFVTLKKNGSLRGCIGTIAPVKPLYKAVLDNAVNAAAFDKRFQPVTPEELDQIEIEISVLTPPRTLSSLDEFILAKHGIILSKAGHSAVFLPQVAPEQGWTVAETLTHLSRKAGLPLDAWKKDAKFEVFEALVFSEHHH